MLRRMLWLVAILLVGGCAVNPVTGRTELALVPESTELNIGAEQYGPARQMQGGDYVAHPEINAYVSGVGQRLAAVSDRELPYEFSVINDSTPNAWALPGGKIAVNRGLLTELGSEAELAAVLGHEIVHAAARHGAQGMQRGLLLQGAVLAAGVASSNSEYAGLAVGGANLAAGLITHKYSRDAEREADYYGMQYMARAGYDPTAAVDLQETFVRLSEGRNPGWLSGLFASHPPSPERVAANRQTARELPPGGERGAEAYRRALAPLTAAGEAYAAYDRGRAALAEKQPAKALEEAGTAIRIEPKEALFYGLRGDALRSQGQERAAVAAYDQAVRRNPGYFHFYLQRGLAREELGLAAQATADLERSVELLPTAPGLNALGQLALARGQGDRAREYFASAAGSDSPAGRQAYASLVRLDLPRNPGKYLKVDFALDRQGMLVARLANPTPLLVAGIRLQVGYTDAAGRARQTGLAAPGPVAAGAAVQIPTGLGPIPDTSKIRNLGARITAARIAE